MTVDESYKHLIIHTSSSAICFVCLAFSNHHCHDNLLKQVNNEWVKIYPWNWHDGYGQGLVYIPSWQAESTGCHSISSDGASKRVSVETTPNAKQNEGHFLCRTPEGCLFLCTYQPISRRVPAMNSYSVLRQQQFAMIWFHLCSQRCFLRHKNLCSCFCRISLLFLISI